nr:putative reverse transcriptase domain-containing protein [Tanacetum cinerariifolium]
MIRHEIVHATIDNSKSRTDLRLPAIVKRATPITIENLWNICVGDHVLLKMSPWKGVMHFGKKDMVEIMDSEVKKLKRSKILIVKVRWNSKRGPEFTWEQEDHMRLKYPHLFEDGHVPKYTS